MRRNHNVKPNWVGEQLPLNFDDKNIIKEQLIL